MKSEFKKVSFEEGFKSLVEEVMDWLLERYRRARMWRDLKVRKRILILK